MGKSLNEIAKELRDSGKDTKLIYAFNGSGKTRLSMEFRNLIDPKIEIDDNDLMNKKMLYYNAFTEDLFYWDNDLENNVSPKLIVHPNSFTEWIFGDQGQEQNIISFFQNYSNEKLNPKFNYQYMPKIRNGKEIILNVLTEVTFSYERGNDDSSDNIKISKGEESCFIWCVFYSLLDQVVNVLNIAEKSERETNQFDDLEYVFIDDPVSSLDDNHLIEMAVNIGQLIKKCDSTLKFIITTHNPLFYNVLFNEIKQKKCYMLERSDDFTYKLIDKAGGSNRSFSYHLHLKKVLEIAIATDSIEKYHFTLLRNMYEKTASFLGYTKWQDLLPDDKTAYYKRIINFASHSTIANESIAEPTPHEKQTVKFLLDHLTNTYMFWKES